MKAPRQISYARTGWNAGVMPDTVVVSCFDPVRREVGRLALEKLVVTPEIQSRIDRVRATCDAEIIK